MGKCEGVRQGAKTRVRRVNSTLPVQAGGLPEHNVARYAGWVIRSFGNAATERLWLRQRPPKLDPRSERVALRKLVMLDGAEVLDDLRMSPGNRLEALSGDRAEQHKPPPRGCCVTPSGSMNSSRSTSTG